MLMVLKKEKLILLKYGDYNDKEVSKAIATEKEIVSITLDPDLETADIDTSNNAWPKEVKESQFDKFKNTLKD